MPVLRSLPGLIGIDHGTLAGLGDDDHPQYLLADINTRQLIANLDFNFFQALSFRTENVGVLPAFGNPGRLVYLTTDGRVYRDTGAAWIAIGIDDHGDLFGLGDDDHPQYLLVDGTRAMTGTLDMGTFDITNVGLVDGRDISVDGTTLDTHLDGGFNKHDASEIDVESAGNYHTITILSTVIDQLDAGITSVATDIANHLDGGPNKHDASEIDVEGTYGNIPGTPTDLESTIAAIDTALGSATDWDRVLGVLKPHVATDGLDIDAVSHDVTLGSQNLAGTILSELLATQSDGKVVNRVTDTLGTQTLQSLTELLGTSGARSGLTLDLASNVPTAQLAVRDISSNINRLIVNTSNIRMQIAGNSIVTLDGTNIDLLNGQLLRMGVGASPNTAFAMVSGTADAGSNVAYTLDTSIAFTSGRKLLSLRNLTVEKFAIDDSGNLTLSGTVDGRDVATDGTTLDTHLNGFPSKHDASEIDVEGTYSNIPGTPTDLESTIAAINTKFSAEDIWDRSGSDISPHVPGDNLTLGAGNITLGGLVDGRDVSNDGATLDTHLTDVGIKHNAGRIQVQGTYANIVGTPTDLETTIAAINGALGGALTQLTSATDISAFIDNNNDQTDRTFSIYHDVTTPTVGKLLFQVRENGEVEIYGGPLIGGASPFHIKSKDTDGASAIGFRLNTVNALSTSGARLLTLENNSVEAMSINIDGLIKNHLDKTLVLLSSKITDVSIAAHTLDTTTTIIAGHPLLRLNNNGANRVVLTGAGQLLLGAAATLPSSSYGLVSTHALIQLGDGVVSQTALFGNVSATGSLDLGVGTDPFLKLQNDPTTKRVDVLKKIRLNLGGANTVIESSVTDTSGSIGLITDTVAALTANGALLADLRNATVSKLSISKDGDVIRKGGNGVWSVMPNEGAAGISAAITSATIAGGDIELGAGVYDMGSGLAVTATKKNIRIKGVPGTILRFTGASTNPVLSFTGTVVGTNDEPVNDVTVDDALITITTLANATAYLAGDVIVLTGSNSDTGDVEQEIHTVEVNGNGGTGAVSIRGEIQRNMTGVTVRAYRGMTNIKLENLRIERDSTALSGHGIVCTHVNNIELKNIEIAPAIGFAVLNEGAVFINCNEVSVYDDCKIVNALSNGIRLSNCLDATIKESFIEDMATSDVQDAGIKLMSGCHNILLDDNTIKTSGAKGINVLAVADVSIVAVNSSIHIINNYLAETERNGIDIEGNSDCIVDKNTLIRCTDQNSTGLSSINIKNTMRSKATGNILKLFFIGIDYTDATRFTISSNEVIKSLGTNDGIFGENANGGTIDHNVVEDCVNGIMLGNTSARISVTGNRVRDCLASGIAAVDANHCSFGNNISVNNDKGLSLDSLTTFCAMTGNILSDNTTIGLEDLGSNNQSVANIE